nr:adenylate/guanylate cyclase domain-containing protein [Paraburkholderia sp. BL8N3]
MAAGGEVALAEERREATALFADISDYTTLCAKSDAEEVQAMLDRFYAAMETVVARHGGQVLNRMGDAVMAVFGAPVAHGNDPERAVRTAIEMHAEASEMADCEGRPLTLHIGVARGEVLVTKIGSGGQAARGRSRSRTSRLTRSASSPFSKDSVAYPQSPEVKYTRATDPLEPQANDYSRAGMAHICAHCSSWVRGRF